MNAPVGVKLGLPSDDRADNRPSHPALMTSVGGNRTLSLSTDSLRMANASRLHLSTLPFALLCILVQVDYVAGVSSSLLQYEWTYDESQLKLNLGKLAASSTSCDAL